MTIQAFRITSRRFLASAFDGEGARRYGGRWNSPGTRMIYVAESLALATLELLVHIEDRETVFNHYMVIPVRFASSLVEVWDPARDLPPGWVAPQPTSATQILGDQWIREQRTAVVRVPSAVVQRECNYLLNPDHRDFARIKQLDAFDLELDPRLKL